MSRPARIEFEGAFYHVMNRGNRREDIFLDTRVREKFYEILILLHPLSCFRQRLAKDHELNKKFKKILSNGQMWPSLPYFSPFLLLKAR